MRGGFLGSSRLARSDFLDYALPLSDYVLPTEPGVYEARVSYHDPRRDRFETEARQPHPHFVGVDAIRDPAHVASR
jgi:hypothetical protein